MGPSNPAEIGFQHSGCDMSGAAHITFTSAHTDQRMGLGQPRAALLACCQRLADVLVITESSLSTWEKLQSQPQHMRQGITVQDANQHHSCSAGGCTRRFATHSVKMGDSSCNHHTREENNQ